MTPSPKYFFYLMALIVILQANFSLAYENDSPLGRKNYEQNYLDQLHFRTPGQDFLTTFSFLPDVINHTTTTTNGTQSSQSLRDRFPIFLSEILGVTDLLSIQASESYLFHSVQTNINDRTGVTTTPSSSGFSDPSFTANYRYLGGLVGTTFGDGFVSFSPSTGDNQAVNTTQNGNNLRGDTTIEVGTDLYHVINANEFSAGASWIYNTSKNIDSPNSTNNEVGSNYSDFDVRLRYRYHLNEFFFTQVQGTFYMPYDVNYSYYNAHNPRTEADALPFYVIPRFTLGYLPVNSTLLTTGVAYTSYTRDYTPDNNGTTATDSSLLHEVTLDFGVSFLF